MSGPERYQTILLHRDAETRCATITLNRPDKRNAINARLIEDLRLALSDVENDPNVTVIILRGAGDAFCSGADLASIQAMQSADYSANLADSRALRDCFHQLYEYPKPTIAGVRGPALAGGAGLATCCDFIVAESSASFGYPEVKIGFVAAMVMVLLTRQVGERAARDLLLTGRRIKADEAQRMGLISRVCADGELEESVAALAASLVSNSPQAMSVSKHLLSKVWTGSIETNLDEAAALNARVRGMDDCLEGIAAFLEKRSPQWCGNVTVSTSKA